MPTDIHTLNAIAGAAGAPLSREQKTRLILAAQSAHRMQVKAGMWLDADGDFEAFRHAAAFDACGVASWRAMQQRHYLPALLHFRELAGSNVRATQERLSTDDERRALSRLKLECTRCGDCFGGWQAAWSYAGSLFRKIHRCDASSASAKQVWQVIFTLRNRAAARRRQESAGNCVRMRFSGGREAGGDVGPSMERKSNLATSAGYRGPLAGVEVQS